MAELALFNPITKNLAQIARFLGVNLDNKFSEILITGISSNSKTIDSGELFLALPGATAHGSQFIKTAEERGARAVITDQVGANSAAMQNSSTPILVVTDPRSQVGFLCDWFYNAPSRTMQVVGITGTNGKTTTTFILHQIWQFADFQNGLIGTVGIKLGEEFFPTTHTTPESDVVHRILSIMQERHLRNVAMEVSSHALVQHRVDGIRFTAAGFTNLSQDHLDFHGNMEDYYQAKRRLFDPTLSEFGFINIDDYYGARLFSEVTIPSSSISIRNKSATWHYESVARESDGYQVAIRGAAGVLIEGKIKLLGEYNLENSLMAVAIAAHSGVDPLVIGQSLSHLTGAPGRLERIDHGQPFTALVDFAHSPDAVTKVLETLRGTTKGRVIGVLGCGGDRDKSKRPLMGSALFAGCDVAVFTSDNPRSEDPSQILHEMTAGLSLGQASQVISNRSAAIAHAVNIAQPEDTVVVLGKGHETGQEINGVIHPFSDQLELRKAIEALS